MPAKKKELPWLEVPGGRMRTTLFYGPWQCNRRWMASCQQDCAREGRQLMGCMWLVDIKLEWLGRLVVPPLPVESGGRLAITHCCCNYRVLAKAERDVLRKNWEKFRDSYRRDWSRKFGEWPLEGGEHWPGHHIRDLKHGGLPTDHSNIIPVPLDVHGVLNEQYPVCYGGGAPWNTVGPDLPYRDL